MVSYVQSRYDTDPERVFVTGTSSGAMMTQVMLADYPDVFAAGSSFAGVPASCFATTDGSSWNSQCAQGQVNKTPQQWGDLVRGARLQRADEVPSDRLVDRAQALGCVAIQVAERRVTIGRIGQSCYARVHLVGRPALRDPLRGLELGRGLELSEKGSQELLAAWELGKGLDIGDGDDFVIHDAGFDLELFVVFGKLRDDFGGGKDHRANARVFLRKLLHQVR